MKLRQNTKVILIFVALPLAPREYEQQKHATRLATLLQNELNSNAACFSSPAQNLSYNKKKCAASYKRVHVLQKVEARPTFCNKII